jgi:hypothetical protein
MPFSQYALAGTFNRSGSLSNVEGTTVFPPRAKPVPLGTERIVLLDGSQQVNGAQVVTWQWGFLDKSKLDSLVTGYIGSYDIPSAPVTMVTRKRDNQFGTFNAHFHLPIEGEDYEMPVLGTVTDLHLRFYIVGTAT